MNRNLSWDQFKDHMDATEKASPHWEIDVSHSSHDELQQGKTEPRHSHVILSKEHHPDPLDAEQTAALMAFTTRKDQYVTRVGVRV